MLAEELMILNGDSPLWQAVRPILDAALRLEQNNDAYLWHGWSKQQVSKFLQSLPPRCSLVVGVWEAEDEVKTDDAFEHEPLVLGVVCEVLAGEVCSIRTFEALVADGLKPVHQLEPGIEDALEIMRHAKMQVAPVAWALFTDRTTWNEWLLAESGDGNDDDGGNGGNSNVIDKGALLSSLAGKGRCVLMGSQAAHHHR